MDRETMTRLRLTLARWIGILQALAEHCQGTGEPLVASWVLREIERGRLLLRDSQ